MCDSSDGAGSNVSDSRLSAGFLSKFGHEVRSPLNAIIGFSEMLADEAFGPLSDDQREVARDILNAGRHLQQLVSDALDASRLRLGNMDLTCDALSVASTVEQALALTAALAAEKNIQFSHMVPVDIAVTADERRLTQVLYNLLENAVRF
ncbi:MAG: sensor histidine kinase, partial [Bacteroidota bacterium]